MIDATTAAVFAFLLSRSSRLRLAFPAIKSVGTRKSVVYVSKKIMRQSRLHGFRLIFILPLSRLPYIALSYSAGFSSQIKIGNFIVATALSYALSTGILVIVGVVAATYFAVATSVAMVSYGIYKTWRQRHRADSID